MKKTIGILGGMGPEATAYMFELIIKHTKAEKDQDHIPVIIYSNPKIPHRTEAIIGKGPSPVPHLVESIKTLLQAGSDFIIIPCITAHHFIPELKAEINFPFISLLDESLIWAKEKIPEVKRAGLIASKGTIKSRLFHKTFSIAGIEIFGPDEQEQEQIMEAIFGKEGIKAGFRSDKAKETIVQTARKLIARGAEGIIAGCTEIPLVLEDKDISVPLIEPMRIVAEKSIVKAGYEVKS